MCLLEMGFAASWQGTEDAERKVEIRCLDKDPARQGSFEFTRILSVKEFEVGSISLAFSSAIAEMPAPPSLAAVAVFANTRFIPLLAPAASRTVAGCSGRG